MGYFKKQGGELTDILDFSSLRHLHREAMCTKAERALVDCHFEGCFGVAFFHSFSCLVLLLGLSIVFRLCSELGYAAVGALVGTKQILDAKENTPSVEYRQFILH